MTEKIEIQYVPPGLVDITNNSGVSVDIVNQDPVNIELNFAYRGPIGPAGPQGEPGPDNVIAGYPVVLNNLTQYDVLAFSDNSFTNRKQIELTDGGNF
jgi:hypothetical protein